MEVLSSRVLVSPTDLERSLAFYEGVLGLRRYREFGRDGRILGVVLFLGGGFLELSGGGTPPVATPGFRLWLQVPDVDAEHDRLRALGADVLAPPETMPWGLREMWLADPDGVRIGLVEVPEDHPLRRRL
jgi:predicted enzyme related to lactoylglutathione lyase